MIDLERDIAIILHKRFGIIPNLNYRVLHFGLECKVLGLFGLELRLVL